MIFILRCKFFPLYNYYIAGKEHFQLRAALEHADATYRKLKEKGSKVVGKLKIYSSLESLESRMSMFLQKKSRRDLRILNTELNVFS